MQGGCLTAPTFLSSAQMGQPLVFLNTVKNMLWPKREASYDAHHALITVESIVRVRVRSRSLSPPLSLSVSLSLSLRHFLSRLAMRAERSTS